MGRDFAGEVNRTPAARAIEACQRGLGRGCVPVMRSDREPDWERLFPADEMHRFRMAMRRGEPAEFWPERSEDGAIVEERRRWLAGDDELYLAGTLTGPEVTEAVAWMRAAAKRDGSAGGTWSAREAAERIEPDWVVLGGAAGAGFPVLGGAVVFPSGWALTEKLGRPLAEVHGVVPTLQPALGRPIDRFLERLDVGEDWIRVNWGLSADAGLNHHPSRPAPVAVLTAEVGLADAWLRIETQYLARLPETGAVLFGIRIENRGLAEVAARPAVAARLARALRTMEPAVAAYKGLTACRAALADQLDGGPSSGPSTA